MTFERILAIQVKMIGDLLLTLPALQALRTAYPEARLELLTLGPSAELAPCLPWIDRVYSWDKRRSNFSTLKPLLRGTRPDLTLDFSGTDRAAVFTSLGKVRVGYHKYTKSRTLRKKIYTKTSKAALKHQHAASYYLGLLDPLGLAPQEGGTPPKPGFVIPDAAREEAEQALRRHGVDGPFVALQPGSSRIEKFWPAQQWSHLIAELNRRGKQVVILGGSSQVERDHLERIDLLSLIHNPVDLGGKLSLPASAAVLDRAESLIGVDSALTHLAAVLDKPQLALYGTTDPFHWGPYNDRALSLHASLPDQPRARQDWNWKEKLVETPLRDLALEPVLEAFDKLPRTAS